MSAVECRGTEVSVPGGPRLATVDAVLRPGRFAAIVGPNGAGKSTLLSLLSGQRAPAGGAVWWDGVPVHRQPAAHMAQRRAVVLQDSAVAFDFTVRDVVEMGRFPHRRAPSPREHAIVEQALAATQVAHLAHRSLPTLSGGERARAHLARALAQVWEPCPCGAARWLLLDEPTAALDLAHQHQAMALARRWASERGVGVVAVLHDLNLALRYADDALVLGNGAAVFGAVADTLTAQTIAEVWKVACTPARSADGARQFLFG